MRFNAPCCPECGGPPTHIIERILCEAPLSRLSDGSFEYSGEQTKVDWCSSEIEQDAEGNVDLTCDDCHAQWTSHVAWV
jgi:hypothetical protein